MLFLLCFLLLFSCISFSSPSPDLLPVLTEEELAWLQNHPVIRVSNEDDYPPFDFSLDGEPRGLSIEYMDLIAKRLGVTFEYVNGYSWGELLQLAKNKELDVMQTIVKTPDRQEYLLFAEPFYDTPVVIAVQESKDDLQQLEDLFGKRVAIVDDYFYEAIIRDKYPDIEMLLVPNMAEALKKVSFGEADATVEVPGVINYEIRQNFLNNIKITGEIVNEEFDNKLNIAIRDDWPLLHTAIIKAQESITIDETTPIWNRWVSSVPEVYDNNEQVSLVLTSKEQQWLNDHSTIRFVGDPNWLPFEAFTDEGEYIGIVAEHLELIEDRLGISLEKIQTQTWSESIQKMQDGEADLISVDISNPSLKPFFIASEPYVTNGVIILMQESQEFITDLYQIEDHSIAVIKDYGYVSQIQAQYPDLTFIEVNDIEEGLQKVSTGQLDALLCRLAVGTYMLGELGIHNVKIVGQTDIMMDLGFFIRPDWDTFQSILNKAINSISMEERREILNRWGRHEAVIERVDYQLITQIIIVFFVILLFVFIWSWRLRREVSLRKKIEKELEASEAKAWSLLESTPDGMVVVNQSGEIVMVNDRVLLMFGYQKHEVIGEPVECLLPQHLREQHVIHVNGFFRNPETRMMGSDRELTGRRKDGSVFPIDVSLSPVESDGETLVTAAIRDVTERKQREQLVLLNSRVGEILTQADSIHDSLQQCADAMVHHLEASLIRFWLLNPTENALEMHASSGLYTHIDGEHSRVPVGERKVGKIAQGGKSYISNDIANDSMIDNPEWAKEHGLIGFAGIPLMVGNRLIGMMVKFATHDILPYRLKTLESISQNIAIAIDRMQSEGSLRLAQHTLKNTGDAIIWVDWDTSCFMDVNDTACTMSGYSYKELTTMRVSDLDADFADDKWSDFREMVKKAGVFSLESRHQSKEGTIYPVEITINFTEHENQKYLIAFIRDITPRKKLEEELRQAKTSAEEKLSQKNQVFQDAADPIIIEDLDGIVIEANDAAIESYGWAAEELIGKPILTIVPPERHEQARELLEKCKSDEDIRNVEGIRCNKDGNLIPVLITLSLLKDESDHPIGIATIAKDITEQKNAEQELIKKSIVFKEAADAIIIEDLDGIIVEANDEAIRSYGWSKEELIGKPILMIVPPERHDQARELLEKCKADEDVRNIEGIRCDKNGNQIPVLISLSILMDEAGNSVGVATIAKDITKQKKVEEELRLYQNNLEQLVEDQTKQLRESQERLDLAIQTSGIGIWDWDIKDDAFELDDTLLEISGLKESNRRGKREEFLNLVHPADIDLLEESMRDALEQRPTKETEFRILREDNEIRYVSSNRKVIFDESNQPIRMVGVCRDVTEKRQAERKIQESQQFLQGLIDNSTALVYAKSVDGKYTLVNKKWCELFNISKDAIIGKTDHEVFPVEEADEFRRNDLEVIETCHPVQEEESVTINGHKQTYMSLKFPILDSNGIPYAVCGMSSEITELKTMEENLRNNIDALDRFRKMAVDRELKMIELKREINNYLVESGSREKYKIHDQNETSSISTN